MNPEATATSTDTMRAITQTRYGNSDVLRLAQVPRPVVRDDQVLIRVHAAGLDRGTEHLMTGKPYAVRLASGIRRPKNPVPGRDVAGTVVEVGAKVTRFSPGDHVYGVAPGSYAEYAVTGENRMAHKPANLSFAEASVIPISAGTALQALTDAGRVQPGQSVLITGASGGVGSYAVQLAASLGADVTGVCSSAKPRRRPRRPPRHRLQPRRLGRRQAPLRPDPRHCRQPACEPAASCPDAARDGCLRRR
jgi:NADPH:quinone reductase-like Zn-dependent oxidoreductase